MDYFKSLLCDELSKDILDGSKVIFHTIPEQSRGFIVIEYGRPKTEKNDNRIFYYSHYEIMKYSDGSYKFYKACDYVKMTKKQVIKRAIDKFYGR